jgi:crotonobetainyl-CoA:carnitine CoA-transferase CaiB-like acyl-CoA transferase
VIGDAFRTRPAAAWSAELDAAKIAASPALPRDQWMDTPQLAAIGTRASVEDPERARS